MLGTLGTLGMLGMLGMLGTKVSQVSWYHCLNPLIPGNLYITFDVKFPRGDVTAEDKKSIMKIINMSSVQTVYNGL